MKILHVETGQHLYGGAKQVHFLIEGLQQKGVTNILCCPKNAAIGAAVETLDEKVVYTDTAGDLDLRFFRQLSQIIKRTHPDLIHLHSRRGADVLGGIAAKIKHIPCVLSRRVDNPENKLLVKIKYPLYDHIITISDKIRRVLISEGVPQEKITCVRSAVDAKKYQRGKSKAEFIQAFHLPHAVLTLAIIAQLIPRKGHRYLFASLPELVKSTPNIRVLVFGQGPLEAELKQMASSLQLAEHVIFPGFCPNIEDWLENIDIVVHPAEMEGLGVALLQAAAAGVPIVASRAGGIPEVVRDQVNGFLSPPGDSTQLAEHVKILVHDKMLRKKFGDAGRHLAETEFSLERMISGNLTVYQRLLLTQHSNISGE